MRMPEFDGRILELHNERFKAYEGEAVRKAKLKERAQENESARNSRRAAFLKRLGIDAKLMDVEEKSDFEHEGKALDAFLKEFRPAFAARESMRSTDANWAGVRTAALGEAHHMVLSPYAADIYSTSADTFEANTGESGAGAINSGWIFPDDPSRIRIKDGGHVGTACFEAYAEPPEPVFAVHFCFVPAATASYEMTAVLAFHGFYVLRSNDSWWNCRHAHARLSVSMNVNQYVDHGWRSFPPLIDRYEQNAEEIESYDHTGFFDYTAVLRAGDPVVVTVRGKLDALGVGGHTYAELNFEAGTANYIWPLFLSVNQI